MSLAGLPSEHAPIERLRDPNRQPPRWGARRIATTKDGPEQKHRANMLRCWRRTVELELELGWEASPSVLDALEDTPEDIRARRTA